MDTKTCAKCGKTLKEYEVNYRLVDDKTCEVCMICAMAIDYKNGADKEDKNEPVKETKKPETASQQPKKISQADIDSILARPANNKSTLPLGKLFETNNNIASILKAAAAALFCIGFILGIIFIAFIESYGLIPSMICWVMGIISSLLFLGISEIISLLTSINNKLK